MKATQMTKIIITVGVSVLALSALAQAPAPGSGRGHRRMMGANGGQRRSALPWSKAAGKPDIDAGHTVGFYIWHEGSTVYVVSADESDKGQMFTGRILVQGGTISDTKGLHDEKRDRFRQPKPNVLAFRFDTHEATDGVKFTLNGGKHILFKLALQGHKTGHIFIGANATEVERDPVVFDLSK